MQKCGVLSRGTSKYRGLPSTPLNALRLQQLNPLQAQVHTHTHTHTHPPNEQNHCWACPSSSTQSSRWNLTVQTLCLCTTCISPQFGLLPSKPPLLMQVYKHQDELYRSNFIKTGHLYCAWSWGPLPATQAKDIYCQLSRFLLLGITRANFKPRFILILVKSLHPSRAFRSRLASLLLTIR